MEENHTKNITRRAFCTAAATAATAIPFLFKLKSCTPLDLGPRHEKNPMFEETLYLDSFYYIIQTHLESDTILTLEESEEINQDHTQELKQQYIDYIRTKLSKTRILERFYPDYRQAMKESYPDHMIISREEYANYFATDIVEMTKLVDASPTRYFTMAPNFIEPSQAWLEELIKIIKKQPFSQNTWSVEIYPSDIKTPPYPKEETDKIIEQRYSDPTVKYPILAGTRFGYITLQILTQVINKLMNQTATIEQLDTLLIETYGISCDITETTNPKIIAVQLLDKMRAMATLEAYSKSLLQSTKPYFEELFPQQAQNLDGVELVLFNPYGWRHQFPSESPEYRMLEKMEAATGGPQTLRLYHWASYPSIKEGKENKQIFVSMNELDKPYMLILQIIHEAAHYLPPYIDIDPENGYKAWGLWQRDDVYTTTGRTLETERHLMEALTRRIEWSIFPGSPKLNYDSDHPYRIIDNILTRLNAILTKADCPSLMEFHLNTNVPGFIDTINKIHSQDIGLQLYRALDYGDLDRAENIITNIEDSLIS